MVKTTKTTKVDQVLALIAGGSGLREACSGVGLTVPDFLEKVDGERYERARNAQAEALFDEVGELERLCQEGELEPTRFKALLDSRKWRLAQMRPHLYGDKADSAASAEGGQEQIAENGPNLSALSPEQLMQLAQTIFKGQA